MQTDEPTSTGVDATAAPVPAVPGKKQLSEAQKAGLAKAREKAREKKLAISKAKADAVKAEEEAMQAEAQKKAEEEKPIPPASREIEVGDESQPEEGTESDEEMLTSSEEEPTPPPSPVKPKKNNKKPAKRQRVEQSTDDDSSGDEMQQKQADANHASLTRAAYEQQLAQYKSDVIYKQLFPYL